MPLCALAYWTCCVYELFDRRRPGGLSHGRREAFEAFAEFYDTRVRVQ